MTNLQTTFLATAVVGFLLAVVGSGVATAYRREDVPFSIVFWAGSDVVAHPERYVRPERLALVRGLSLVGLGLLAAGSVACVVCSAIQPG
jgi:hypothetical protein